MLRTLLRACVLLAATALPSFAETYALQTPLTSAWVGVDGSGLLAAGARRSQALTLEMIPLTGNRVAFRDPASGLFLRAGVGAQTRLAVASPHIRGWETFELHRAGDEVSLRSVQSGAWVGFDGVEPRLDARWATRGQGQAFRLIPVAAQAPATAGLPFAGTWALDEVLDGGRVVAVSPGAVPAAWLRVGADGALDGHSGCNGFNAALRVERRGLRVIDFMTTRIGCHGNVREVERLFHAALTHAADFTIEHRQLVIRDANGAMRARFLRR